jgi:subtilisin family serine protease
MRARQAALFWLVVLGGAALPAACPPAAARADGGATYVLDPKAVLQGSSYLETDLPADWTGMVVNSFVGANRFYASGITGQETTTANIEAGLIWGGATGHQTLTQVTNYYADTTDGALGAIDRHATWVGMIIGGQNVPGNPKDWQTGIAPGTNLCSGAIATAWSGTAYGSGFTSSADPTFSITTATMLNAYNHYFGTADVINSSWGFTDPSGTNAWTVALDGLAAANPGTTFVAAVGNNGSGTNRVGAPASGYNSISVGGLGNANNYDTISSTSSGGPQDYKDTTQTVHNVRAAVDLVAPGQDLLTAYYGGQTGGNGTTLSGSAAGPSGNNYYQPVAGTSFAAPIVAGGAALLDSASHVNALPSQSRDARVVRAVLMNSADKIAGWDNGQQSVSGVITTTQSLDWNLGAGRLN